jgi:hypothetical protein
MYATFSSGQKSDLLRLTWDGLLSYICLHKEDLSN